MTLLFVYSVIPVEAADLQVLPRNPPCMLEGRVGDEVRDEDDEQFVEVEDPQVPSPYSGAMR